METSLKGPKSPKKPKTQTSMQDRFLLSLEKTQVPIVDAAHRFAETVDAWLPQTMPTSRLAARLPELGTLADRGAHFADKQLASYYKFAKRLIKNQHDFVKGVVKAVEPLLAEGAGHAPPTSQRVAKTAA